MAESFVLDIANSLLGKLASYSYEEASRAYGVYEDLQGIKDTLSIVKGLLLDAEEKKNQKHGLREWLRQIQNICTDAEDILDGFEFQDKRKQVVKASASTRMKVRHFFSSSNPLAFRFRMAHHIKEIRERLDKVAADGSKFGLVRIDVDPGLVVQRREMTHSHVDSSSIIGRGYDREKIIKLLMQPYPHSDGGKSLCVIPIVGIGGLGKTSLAKLVFNDTRMDELFQLKIWVCVSDVFDIKQIVIQIINSALVSTFPSASAPTNVLSHQENINNLNIEQLQSRLRYKLFGQKFLLVLDDTWNEDRAKWIELEDLIKVGSVGSKVMVTTRSNSVGLMMGTVPSYVLEGLSLENCLSLFVKWAFKEGDEINYPNLVEIGKEIVKKCRGVPLAVKTLGSSLFSKLDLNKWIFVRDSELWNLEQGKDDILPALKLSYDQMPSYLRQCFAYFSLYPKDFTFNSFDISNLWVALGLLHSLNVGENVEDVAREYIDELHSRSFLQDFEDSGYYRKFKVHDLVHDLALYVAKEDFAVVNAQARMISEQARHLSIVDNNSCGHVLFPKSRSVRTILFPMEGVGLDAETLLHTWVSRYRYLRYLDLSDSSFETLPNSIAKLEHLRALDLSHNCKIKYLPQSICKLQNLQVLELGGCTELETLPKRLGKMISLRQLIITTKQFVLSENEFARLNHLRTLGFYYCHNLKYLFKRDQLPSLETLFVVSCGEVDSLTLSMFPNLHTLYISDCKNLNLSACYETPIQTSRMKYLHLEGFPEITTLPRWIEGATNTLETLVIVNCPNLRMLPACIITMPHLKRLYISECPLLKVIFYTSNIHPFTALEDLRIDDGCTELCQNYQPQCGVFWPAIAHIKNVFIGELRGEEE